MSDGFSPPPSRIRPRSGAARRRPSTRHLTAWLAVGSSAVALAIGGGLAAQMAHGKDPALGPKVDRSASASTATSTAAVATNSSPGVSPSQDANQSSPSPAEVTTRAS